MTEMVAPQERAMRLNTTAGPQRVDPVISGENRSAVKLASEPGLKPCNSHA